VQLGLRRRGCDRHRWVPTIDAMPTVVRHAVSDARTPEALA
jgi:hypothetical protein